MFNSESLQRRHGEPPDKHAPVPLARVISSLRTQFKVVDYETPSSKNDFGFDLRYLWGKSPYTHEHLAHLRSVFGEGVVVEALRRAHGRNWGAAYFAGVCRNVAAE